MRIAQIAPLTESVPPRLYGGIERVVSFLTEQLVAMGHDVTLFASGDSVTRAMLVAVSASLLPNRSTYRALPALLTGAAERRPTSLASSHSHNTELATTVQTSQSMTSRPTVEKACCRNGT